MYNGHALDHFVPVEERIIQSPRFARKAGRGSPAGSEHNSLMRQSLMKSSQERKARRVLFYRNGDRFFQGMYFAIHPENSRTFDSFLADLNNSQNFCDNAILPNGIRFIFSINGTKVTSLLELHENESYVCSSFDCFKNIPYGKITNPSWIPSNKKLSDRVTSIIYNSENIEEDRDFVKPKLITVIRNSGKPRQAVRILLNKKTAHSFGQVLADITKAIKLDTGCVKKLYTLQGEQVTSLRDFFQEDSVFIAYGYEKYSNDDFNLDENEAKCVARNKANIRLEQFPLSKQYNGVCCSPASSPKAVRRNRGINGFKDGENKVHSTLDDLRCKYNIGSVIGQGNFAVVRECTERKSGKTFALKVIDKSACGGKESKIINELKILQSVRHPNIIQLIEEINTKDCLYLIVEFVKGGDLFDAISSATKYTERNASSMTRDLLNALGYLHARHIVHRDVKPENLLVFYNEGRMSLKLGDFGLATVVVEPLMVVCGTPTYVAPEILKEIGYGVKVDIWASGILCYILLCGYPPFMSKMEDDHTELFSLIIKGQYEFHSPYWDDISDPAKELIGHMLEADPIKRYSATEAIRHSWLISDAAKTIDMRNSVSNKLNANFTHSVKPDDRAMKLITKTALDKDSGYFSGPQKKPISALSVKDKF